MDALPPELVGAVLAHAAAQGLPRPFANKAMAAEWAAIRDNALDALGAGGEALPPGALAAALLAEHGAAWALCVAGKEGWAGVCAALLGAVKPRWRLWRLKGLNPLSFAAARDHADACRAIVPHADATALEQGLVAAAQTGAERAAAVLREALLASPEGGRAAVHRASCTAALRRSWTPPYLEGLEVRDP